MNRRKIIAILIAAPMILSVGGCQKKTSSNNDEQSKVNSKVENKDSKQEENSNEYPFTLKTKDEQEVVFDRNPEKVISTNVNTGEQLMAMGVADKIIGTCYNNAKVAEKYREEYESKPVLSDKAPSLEVIMELSPDFIYGRSSAFSEKGIGTHDTLSSYNIMSLSSIEGYKLGADVEDVYEDFYNLGKIFDKEEEAEEIVKEMKGRVDAISEKVKDVEKTKVLIFDNMKDNGAYTAGNNFASKLIERAGGENIFKDLETTWATVSWEEVVERNPDYIVINNYGTTSVEDKIKELKTNPALSGLKAVQEENFVVVTLVEVFASSRVADTIETFAKNFHPELF